MLELAPLAGLTDLEELSIAGTPVRRLTPLHSLRRLRRIDIRESAVVPEQAVALRAAIPDVEILGPSWSLPSTRW